MKAESVAGSKRDPQSEIRRRWGGSGAPVSGEAGPKTKEIHKEILDLVSKLRHQDGRLLSLLRRMEQVRGYEAYGCTSMVEYVALLLGVDDLAARERMRVARALETLSLLESALLDGKVSYAKVRAVTRVATPENESEWLSKAIELTAQELEWEVARSRRGGTRPRRLWMKAVDSQTTRMIVDLPAEEMELVGNALDRIRKEGGGTVSSAEALVYMAVESMNSDLAGGTVDPVQIVVHMKGGDVSAETSPAAPEGGRVATQCGDAEVPSQKVERLLCDGAVSVAKSLEDGSVDMSERTRTIPSGTRRAILARDGRKCAVPGCNNKLWVDLHHIKPWWAGGEHTQSNLITICRQHHGAVHEGRLEIRAPSLPGGRPRFFVGSWEMGC